MSIKIIVLGVLLAVGAALEWYELNNPAMLTSHNFTQLIEKDSSGYKIVTFFTPTCRYCRLLKEVEEALKL